MSLTWFFRCSAACHGRGWAGWQTPSLWFPPTHGLARSAVALSTTHESGDAVVVVGVAGTNPQEKDHYEQIH